MSLSTHLQATVCGSTYTSKTCIGEGSFGEVHLMINNAGLQLALKKIKPMVGVDPTMEAAYLQTLQHVNIIKYIDSYVMNGEFWLWTEYCSFGDLNSLPVGQLIPELQLLQWIYQIGSALQYIHGRNIIHRDIKSGNVLLDANMTIKLCDFGSARALPTFTQVAQATPTMTYGVGTQLYMSPEMFNGLNYTEKTDIYSLGAIVYKLANKVYELANGGLWALLNLSNAIHLSTPLPKIQGYSLPLISLVDRMIQKNPDNRPTASDILEDTIYKKKTGLQPSIVYPGQQVQQQHFAPGTVPQLPVVCPQPIGAQQVPLQMGVHTPMVQVQLQMGVQATMTQVPLQTGFQATMTQVPLQTGFQATMAQVPLQMGVQATMAPVPLQMIV